MINATESQRKAINEEGNILVSAAAGSGKTAVLVERVINKIAPAEKGKEPIPANRLLIVTFTNAAAKEMRGRIEKRLLEVIKENPQNEILERQRHLLRSADICTIDSFCINILRQNFSALGISPDFSVGSGEELELRRQAILSELLKPYFDSKDEVFIRLLQLTNCEYDESNLKKYITELFDESMIRPFPDVYFEDLLKPYEQPFESGSLWYDYIMEKAAETVETMVDCVAGIAELAPETEPDPNKYSDYAKQLTDITERLVNAVNSGNYEDVYTALRESEFPNTPKGVRKTSASQKIAVFREQAKELFSYLSDKLFLLSPEEIEDDNAYIYPAAKLLVDFCKKFREEYYKACLEENILTFAFTEQLARELICEYKDGKAVKTAAADEIAGRYDEVMVDEFQDVNDLQSMLFEILSGGGEHLFTVGDVKQSIYGFRGSNPFNFIRRKEQSREANSSCREIPLSENFRSSEGVCNAANFMFGELLRGQTGSIVYTDEDALKPRLTFPDTGNPAAEFILMNNADGESKRTENEALAIVNYIKRTVAEGNIIRTKEGSRPATYGDFAVLFRSLKEKANTIVDLIQANGIPVCYNSEVFSETAEIKLMLSLLKVIDNPKSDVELLSIMMSPVFCFTPDDMADIRKSKKESLYSSVIKAAGNKNKKSEELINKLSEYRRAFAMLSLGEAIELLYADTDILNIVSVMSGGASKAANLRMLSKLVSDYGKRYSGGISGFLKYLEGMGDKGINPGCADQSGVKIMTMHGSKGLQFPICILANLTNKFSKKDTLSPVIPGEKYGLSFKRYDAESMTDRATVSYMINAECINHSMTDEEIRLLYVAATRAEDRVCYVCSFDNLEKRAATLTERFSQRKPYLGKYFMDSCGCMSDFVLGSILLSPEAGEIKKLLDVDCPTENKMLGARISLVRGESIETEAEHTEEARSQDSNPELTEKMKGNFSYKYPYEALRGIEAKVSVSSEANGEEAEAFAFTAKPEFMLQNGMSAAGRGTAMHHVMQYISFDDGISVEEELERLIEWKYISEAEAKAIDVEAIKRFFESELFRRIRKSTDVRREMRFLSEIPIEEIKEGTSGVPEGTKVLIQGAVDLCFIEGDEVVVLDFKTDRVKNMETLSKRYKEQLDIYSGACEKILGKKVKEKIIYSFWLSDKISV